MQNNKFREWVRKLQEMNSLSIGPLAKLFLYQEKFNHGTFSESQTSLRVGPIREFHLLLDYVLLGPQLFSKLEQH